MKNLVRIFPYTAIASLAIMAASCHTELDTYDGEDGMYFDTKYNRAETLSDTIDVSWGMKNSSILSQEIGLVVKLFGHTAPVDRAFDVVIEEAPTYVSEYKPSSGDDSDDDVNDGDTGTPGEEEESTEVPTEPAVDGIDYIIGGTTFVIPAGEAEVTIPITLMRRDDLHLCKRSFKVRLIENQTLKFLFSRSLPEYDAEGTLSWRPIDFQRVIRMDESFPVPTWWFVRGQPYFGNWSQKKAMLICDVMNIDRERWMADELQAGYLRFCGQYMQQYLNEQAALGNVIYEDDGETVMEMGTLSQM